MTFIMNGEEVTARLLYYAVEKTNSFALDDAVQGMIAEGWRTVGGVSVAAWYQQDPYSPSAPTVHFIYCQAMEKTVYDPNPSPPPPTE